MADEPVPKRLRLEQAHDSIETPEMEDEIEDEGFIEGLALGNEEPLPNHVAFHPNTQSVIEALYAIKRKMQQSPDSPQAAFTEDMLGSFSKLNTVENEKFKVGLIGDAGVGKSTLVNKIIDVPDCAAEGASGTSRSCVPVFYQSTLPRQSKKLAAQIVFKDKPVIKDMLVELFEPYEKYATACANGSSEAEIDELSGDATTAVNTVKGLVKGQPKSNLTDSVEKLMAKDPKGFQRDVERICAQIIAQSTEESEYHEEDDGNSLNKSISRYSLDISTNPAQLWPLVDKINIGIRDRRILNHITIVDLPGENDDHFLRAKAASRMQNECDSILLISHIERILNDKDVLRRLQVLLACSYRMIGLICTHNEVQDPFKMVAELEEQGSCTNFLRDFARVFKNSNERLRTNRTRRNAKAASGGIHQSQLAESVFDEEFLKQTLQTHCMEGRASNIKKQLTVKLSAKTGNTGYFEVFATSATSYQEAENANDPKVAVSGIPHLRKVLLEQAAEGTEDGITLVIDAVQRQLDQINVSSHVGQGPAIRKHLKLFELPELLNESSIFQWSEKVQDRPMAVIEQAYRTNILCSDFGNAIRPTDIMPDQAADAQPGYFQEVCEGWRKNIHHCTYNKTCRYEGILGKVPKNKKPQNWPIELTENLTKMTMSSWDHAKQAVRNEINDLQKLIAYALEDRERSLQAIEDLSSAAKEDLSKLYRGQAKKMRKTFANCVKRAEHDIKKHLRSTFKACALEHGKGMKQRMHDKMNVALSAKRPSGLVKFMLDCCAESLERTRGSCVRQVSELASTLEESLKSCYDGLESAREEPQTTKADTAKRQLADELEAGLKEVQAMLGKIRADCAAAATPGVIRGRETTNESSQ